MQSTIRGKSNSKTTTKPPIVREYNIKGKRYIVVASIKIGAKEDAKTKIRRLIKNEIIGNAVI